MSSYPSTQLVRNIVELRRDLHRYPELAYQEERTAAQVVAYLKEVEGLEVKSGIGGTGVVAVLRGAEDGPCVALRADMDALPITEESSQAWASVNKGVMHACGHDGHTACLVGAVKMLAERRKEIRGSVKFIFQPAEEGGAGAERMCEQGVLEAPDVQAVFGAHCWPREQWGMICLSPGPAMAASDDFCIRVFGKGGHAAAPHLSVDPILVGSQIVLAAQQLISRVRNPLNPAVLSICKFISGTTTNVIPESAELVGTIRTYDAELRNSLAQGLGDLAQAVAHSFGARAEYELESGYPAVVNDQEAFGIVKQAALEVVGEQRLNAAAEPSMGAEDFSYYLQRVPGMFWKFGVQRTSLTPQLHTPQFDFCDETIPFVIKMHTEIALAALSYYSSK